MSRARKDPPNVDGMYTLKVDNLSFKTTPEILREEFKEFGEIGDVYIPRNHSNGESRGFAFVRFIDQRDGEDAQRSMDGKIIDGREIRIQEAKERRPDNPRQYMQQRRGGGYNYDGRERDSERHDRTEDRYDDRGRRDYDRRDYRDDRYERRDYDRYDNRNDRDDRDDRYSRHDDRDERKRYRSRSNSSRR